MSKIFFCLLFCSTVVFAESQLDLDQAIAIALDQNPTKKASEQGIYVAENEVAATFSAYYPDIDFIGSYTRFRERIFLPPFNLPFPTPLLTNPIVGPTNDWNIRIEGSYILYDSGERLAKLRASRANSQIAKEEDDRIAQEIILNVSLAYFSVLSDLDLLEVATENLARSEDHLRIVRERYDVGDVPMADLYRMQTNVAESKQKVVNTRSLVRISKGNLDVTMGLPPNTQFELKRIPIHPIDPATLSISDSFDNAVRFRPEIRSQCYRIDVKYNGIDQARSAFGPKVLASGKLGKRDTDFFPSDTEWALGVGVTVPIFKGYRDVANYRKAQGEYYQEIAGYNAVSLTVRQDVWNAYSRILESLESIETSKAQVADATESMRLAKERYGVGSATITDLLDAQTALLQAQATFVDSFHNYQSSMTTFIWAQGLLGNVHCP
jgi:outer membrane protein TolC